MRKLWQRMRHWPKKRAAPSDVARAQLQALAAIEMSLLANGLSDADLTDFARRIERLRFESDVERLQLLVNMLKKIIMVVKTSLPDDRLTLPEGSISNATRPASTAFLALAEVWGLDSEDELNTSKK